MYLVRWWEVLRSRGREAKGSRGQEVERSWGQGVERSWGQDSERDTFRKNDVLVVSYPQCKSGVICALRTLTWEITFVAHMTHDGTLESVRDSRHESSLPNKFVGCIKVISAVTTPDFSGWLTSPSTKINDGDFVFPVKINDGDVVFPEKKQRNSFLRLHYFIWKLSRNCCKIAAREGWRSFFSALSSIWRMRSRVTWKILPTSSSVLW